MESPRKPIERRREELELFFWAARQALSVVVLAALTVYLIVALIEGQLPGDLLHSRSLLPIDL